MDIFAMTDEVPWLKLVFATVFSFWPQQLVLTIKIVDIKSAFGHYKKFIMVVANKMRGRKRNVYNCAQMINDYSSNWILDDL